jgi:hypothetical protein
MSVARMPAEHAQIARIATGQSTSAATGNRWGGMGEERQDASPDLNQASAEHAQTARIATGQSTSAATDKRWGGMGEERQDAPPHFK